MNSQESISKKIRNKLKKWLVDSYAAAPPFTCINIPTDIISQHMSAADSIELRLESLPLMLIAGPIMESKDWYRKKLWGITPESSTLRRKAADLSFSCIMQLIFYAGPLILKGESSALKIATGVGINLATRAPVHAFLTFPYINAIREEYGTLPANEKRKTPEPSSRKGWAYSLGKTLTASVHVQREFPYMNLEKKLIN